MTRLMVLGGSGMLGHKMLQVLSDRFDDVYTTIRGRFEGSGLDGLMETESAVLEGVDFSRFAEAAERLSDLSPEVVVNCVGVIKQRPEAEDPIASITLNSLLPHQLNVFCRGMGARLIHFSTDCVFRGDRGGYREEDTSDATDLYGRTKLLGEVSEPPALTLRTSIVGRELRHADSLIEWFLSQKSGGKVRGYRRALFSGLTTTRMAHVVGDMIENHPHLTGLYHVAGPWISKLDLLKIVRDQFDVDVEIEPDDSVVIDRTLVGERFEKAVGFDPPSWEAMISELASDETPYEKIRP